MSPSRRWSSAPKKLEIIRLVKRSHLPARRTLQTLGILPSRFYRWYDRYQAGSPEGLEDRPSKPNQVWNRIPEALHLLAESHGHARPADLASITLAERDCGTIDRLPCVQKNVDHATAEDQQFDLMEVPQQFG